MRVQLFVVVAAFVWRGSGAFAQVQNESEQKCINSMNKGMATIAKSQSAVLKKCVRAYAKDSLAEDPDNCTENSAKISSLQSKLVAKGTAVCTDTPAFGPSEGTMPALTGENAAIQVGDGLVGTPKNTNLAACGHATLGDVPCDCQNVLLGKSGKLLVLYMSLFNKCKKAGLKDGTIASVSDLENCLLDGSKLDPKGKLIVANAAVDAMAADCNAAGVAEPFPNGACGGSLFGIGTCLRDFVRCEVCKALQSVDGLSGVDCNAFDDGDTMMTSCS